MNPSEGYAFFIRSYPSVSIPRLMRRHDLHVQGTDDHGGGD
jgi:hypothetical protein